MKIILMGQKAFGKSTLEKFHKETNHEIVAVYCAPDNKNNISDPTKEYAISEGLNIFQPTNFKDKKVIEQIKSHNADLCVMAYFTRYIPKEARNIPKYGTIGFHPSLLPLHRGPSAINWCIIKGSKKTGITIFYPNDKWDEGEILLQKEIKIEDNETLGELYFNKIFPLGVDACIEAVDLIDSGKTIRTLQNESEASYESWCKKSDSKIDWRKPGREIFNLIRGCNPQPGAWSTYNDKVYIFLDIKFIEDLNINYSPGQIIEVEREFLKIYVKNGFIQVYRFKTIDQGKIFFKDMQINNPFNCNNFFI